MNKFLPLALLAIFMISCNNDDEIVTIPDPTIIEPSTADEWYPLAVGNYWIYQHYGKDSLGVISYKSEIDSVYIDGQTEINGTTYFKLHGSDFSPNADSLLTLTDEYVLNNLGEKLFSLNSEDSFLSTVEKQYFSSDMYMLGDTLLDFEIGLLDAKYIRQDITWDEQLSECTIPGWHYWGKGIGPVRRELYFASNCQILGVELIRYHLE